jgi:hypothetical protein
MRKHSFLFAAFLGLMTLASWIAFGFPGIPQPATGDISPSGLAIISLLVVLFLWIVRFVTRNQMREANLADDARLRGTMVNTYLAMAKDNEAGLSIEQRLLIFQALFRPLHPLASEVEPSPTSLLEALVQQVARRGP